MEEGFIKSELFPLYEELFMKVPAPKEQTQCVFCMQWGEDFPKQKRKGVLFVGRAVNGWTERGSLDSLFNSEIESERAFAKKNQLSWVENQWQDSSIYNTAGSAFWRIIKKSCVPYYSPWYSKIAWTNLCKLSPVIGNPSDFLFKKQLPIASRILIKEIEILSPSLVVLITGMNYADEFLSYINDEEFPELFTEEFFGSREKVNVYHIKDTYYALFDRPECRPEIPFINKLKELIEKYA